MDDLIALTKKLCLEVDENRHKIADLEKFRDRHRYPEDGKTTFVMRCEGKSFSFCTSSSRLFFPHRGKLVSNPLTLFCSPSLQVTLLLFSRPERYPDRLKLV